MLTLSYECVLTYDFILKYALLVRCLNDYDDYQRSIHLLLICHQISLRC